MLVSHLLVNTSRREDGRLSDRRYFRTQEGSGACGARVQAAFGLVPWAARVPPTERAGSEGSVLCCLRQRPLWWLTPPRIKGGLKIDGPLARGVSGLTAFQAEGCGIA